MKLNKSQICSLLLTFVITYPLFIPSAVHGQAIKTIFQNPHKYNGKTVQVVGKVMSPHFKHSNASNAYTTFKLTDSQGNSVSVFSFGTLSIKQDDKVTVTGIYQEARHAPPRYGSFNEIDASKGKVEKAD